MVVLQQKCNNATLIIFISITTTTRAKLSPVLCFTRSRVKRRTTGGRVFTEWVSDFGWDFITLFPGGGRCGANVNSLIADPSLLRSSPTTDRRRWPSCWPRLLSSSPGAAFRRRRRRRYIFIHTQQRVGRCAAVSVVVWAPSGLSRPVD